MKELADVLNNRYSKKPELGRALAQALGLPCPSWWKDKPKSVTVFSQCQAIFLAFYEAKSTMKYSWSPKDSGCLNGIIKKLYGITKNTDDQQIINAFDYMINALPTWYVEHGMSLCVINGKFNEIIKEIKSGSNKMGKSTVSESYRKGILDDLRSS